jgi:mRNA-degrading endonuclease toxin of MazEF toxin-antitoxin module
LLAISVSLWFALLPVTSTPGVGLLYPALQPGASGFAKISYALIDQLRSIEKRRIMKIYGELSSPDMRAVDEGLAVFLGLGRLPEETPGEEQTQ